MSLVARLMRNFFASFLEILEIAVIAIVAVVVVRTYLVQPFLVSGTSMYPNFQNGDYVLVDELTYRIRPAERGDSWCSTIRRRGITGLISSSASSDCPASG